MGTKSGSDDENGDLFVVYIDMRCTKIMVGVKKTPLEVLGPLATFLYGPGNSEFDPSFSMKGLSDIQKEFHHNFCMVVD